MHGTLQALCIVAAEGQDLPVPANSFYLKSFFTFLVIFNMLHYLTHDRFSSHISYDEAGVNFNGTGGLM